MSATTTVQGVPLASFVGQVAPHVVTSPFAALGTAARSVQTRAQETVNVKDFGAPGSSGGDSSAGINAAFAYIRGLGPGATATIVFPADTYTLQSPINATGLQSPGIVIEGHGSTLVGAFSGGIVFDFFDTRWLKLRDLYITWDGVHEPAIGLAGGSTGTRVADNHSIENVFIEGNFSTACAYFIATETSAARSLRCWNGDAGASSYALIVDGINHFGVSSTFVPQTLAPDTFSTFNEMLFDQADARKPNGGHAIWIGGVSRHTWTASYVDCQTATQAVVLWASASNTNQTITQLSLDLHQETTACTDVFLVDGPNPAPLIQGLFYQDHRPQAVNSIFRAAAQITSVTVQDIEVNIAQLAQSPVLFANSALWFVSGTLISPSSATLLNVQPGQFSGTQLLPSGTDASALQVSAGGEAAALSTRFGHYADVVADYDADPTGNVDATAAIQAAVNSGKPVWIPAGSYLLGGTITLPTMGARIYGAGMGVSVLKWPATAGAIQNTIDPSLPNSYVELDGFTIAGEFLTNPNSAFNNLVTPDSTVVAVSIFGLKRVRLHHLELTGAPYFGLALHSNRFVDVEACQVMQCARDAISCADSDDVVVRGCRVYQCDDDAITAYVSSDLSSEFSTATNRFVCIGNVITDAKGIRAEGRKHFVIAGNTIERSKAVGISLGAMASTGTGIAGAVTGNTVTNVLNPAQIPGMSSEDATDSNAVYISVAGTTFATGLNAPPGENDPSTGTVVPLYEHVFDTGVQPASAGVVGLTIAGNVLMRTRPWNVPYASYGDGPMFTRRGWLNPTVPANAFLGYAIACEGGLEQVSFSDNIIRGQGFGFQFTAGRYVGVRVRGGSITDIGTAAFVGAGLADDVFDVTVDGVALDLDPMRASPNRTAAGSATWQAAGYPTVWAGNGAALTMTRSTVKNAGQVTDGSPLVGASNTIYALPAAQGFDTRNAGCAVCPAAGVMWNYAILNETPGSTAFDTIAQPPAAEAAAIPVSGTWVAGQFVHNNAPALSSGAMTFGWSRITTGSGNVAGTDWAPVMAVGGSLAALAGRSLLGVGSATGQTISAGMIVAGYTLRWGQGSSASDTLDTAANIVAAIPNCVAGTAFVWRYGNQGAFTQTLTAGTGITLNGTATVAAGTWREFFGYVSSMSPAAIVMTNIGSGQT